MRTKSSRGQTNDAHDYNSHCNNTWDSCHHKIGITTHGASCYVVIVHVILLIGLLHIIQNYGTVYTVIAMDGPALYLCSFRIQFQFKVKNML